mgnify:CR=1 FL=1
MTSLRWFMIFLSLSGTLYACVNAEQENKEDVQQVVKEEHEVKHQAKVITFEALQQRLANTQGKTLYVNFWATWCKPCVEEMPAFLKLAREEEDFNLLLVSLDAPDKRKSKVLPFLKKNDIQQEVVILDHPNGGKWISAIAEEWSGAIPATLAVNASKQLRRFHEGTFTYNQLKSFYQQMPNP